MEGKNIREVFGADWLLADAKNSVNIATDIAKGVFEKTDAVEVTVEYQGITITMKRTDKKN